MSSRFEVEITKKLAEISGAALALPMIEGVAAKLANLQGQALAYRAALDLHKRIMTTDMDEAA